MTMERTAARPGQRLAAHDLTVRGTITLGCLTMAVVTVLDLVNGTLGFPFSLGFVLIVITLPLAIDVRQLFPAGVLPPLLLLGALLGVCIARPDAISVDGLAADAGLFTRYLAAVVDHGLTLAVGHALAIGVIIWRILSDA
jgi:hypothetical protein